MGDLVHRKGNYFFRKLYLIPRVRKDLEFSGLKGGLMCQMSLWRQKRFRIFSSNCSSGPADLFDVGALVFACCTSKSVCGLEKRSSNTKGYFG